MKCNICQAEMSCVDQENSIYFCPDCRLYRQKGTFFRAPQNDIEEEKLMDSLEALRRENYRGILHALRQHLKGENLHGLDVGCARGWFLDEAGKVGIAMDGIEPEPRFYEMARPYGDYVEKGLFPQNFHPQQDHAAYDFIIFNDVFEHLPDLDVTLAYCVKLLKPKGLLVINCPDSRGIFFQVAKMLHKLGVDSYWRRLWQLDFYSPHLWYFSAGNLDRLMQKYHLVSEGGGQTLLYYQQMDFSNVSCAARKSGY